MNPSDNIPFRKRPPGRFVLLDEIRGLTLVNMIFYHFLWDLIYIAGFQIPWYHGRGAYVWQQGICWTFIFLSGFCWSLGSHHLKRGLTVYLAGGLVTVVTLVFLPNNRVVFGVLTLIGSSMLLMIPMDKLLGQLRHKLSLVFATSASILIFLSFLPASHGHLANFAGVWKGESFMRDGPELPDWLYGSWFSTYLGFPMKEFFSTDYFPLLPWFFLFMAGYCFHRLCMLRGRLPAVFLMKLQLPSFAFIGRHSLLVYMLHQPVLYGITMMIIFYANKI